MALARSLWFVLAPECGHMYNLISVQSGKTTRTLPFNPNVYGLSHGGECRRLFRCMMPLSNRAAPMQRMNCTPLTKNGSDDSDVLLLDGDILVGAKQNRSVTTTIIIAKKTTSVINVNCVEHGRWSYKGQSFRAGEQPVYSKLRAAKARSVTMNLKSSRGFVADQSAVWNNISMKAGSLRTRARSRPGCRT